MAESKPVSVGPFNLGMNNRLADTQLTVPKVGQFLRDAVNMDIDATGRLSRRAGSAKVISGSSCHSIWAIDDAELFYADGPDLKRVVNGQAATVFSGLAARRVSYDKSGDTVYWSNGSESGKTTGGATVPWSVTLPTQQPLAAVSLGNGMLIPGTYRLYYCFVAASGQESGSSDVATITVAPSAPTTLATGGHRNDDLGTAAIVVSNLPTTLPADAAAVAVYATGPGGDVFMKIGETDQATFAIATMPVFGQVGATVNLIPMPVGDIVRMHNARMLVASKNVVYASEPYALGLHDPRGGYIQFDADVTLIVPFAESGLFVVADKTYWFKSDILTDDQMTVLPYGGVLGSDVMNPSKSSAWWMSTRGLVVGSTDGAAKNLQEDNLAIDASGAGATLFRETNGIKQTVSSVFGPEVSAAAARSFMSADVIRLGSQAL